MTSHRLRDLFLKTDSGVWGEEDGTNGVSILRSTNFTGDGELDLTRVTLRAVENGHRTAKQLSPGDILLEKSGGGPKQPVGRVAMFRGDDQPHVFGNFVARLRPNRQICTPDFPFYILRQMHERGVTVYFQKQTTGIRNLEMRRYLDFQVRLPPLEEQRRIVDILDRAASIRRLRRQAQQTARQIIPALFTKMFGDLASNPMGWPVRTLGDVLANVEPAIRTGPFGSQLRHSEFVNSGVPVLGIDNVVANEFRWTTPRCLPREKFELFRRFLVREGDLLITIMGTTGRCAVAPDNLPECISTKHLCVLTLNQAALLPEFAWAALLFDPLVRSQIDRTGHGAIMEGWNMGLVRRLQVRLPPLSLQQRFVRLLKEVQSAVGKQQRASDTADFVSGAISGRLLG